MAKNSSIIIKKKKAAHHDHHGGAWKVAYADFVTAMMAFFLLLWLLNATTEAQKRGISDYFAPAVTTTSTTMGAGGLLGGKTLSAKGAQVSSSSAPAVFKPMPSVRQLDDVEPGTSAPVDNPSDEDNQLQGMSEAEAKKVVAEREEKRFAAAEFDLRQAIEEVPDLKDLAQNLLIDRTPEGLRIQIVDQENSAMFPSGSADMNPTAKRLMNLVTQVVRRLPNKVSITGHTDSAPFARPGSYSNWELSADRANASRRELLQSELPIARIATVVGKADREPLVANDPAAARNRRISIVLLREASSNQAAAAAPAATNGVAQR
jgi:chemotaxis protein MotB